MKINLSKRSVEKYCSGTPESPSVLLCDACPGKAHDPLDCVASIQRRCVASAQERVQASTRDKERLGDSGALVGKPLGVPVEKPLDAPAEKPLPKWKLQKRQYKAQKQANNCTTSNLAFTQDAFTHSHVCRKDTQGPIRLFCKSFVAWLDNTRKHIVAIVKFHSFAKMDASVKAQFQHLAHHLVAQSLFQNPNKSNGPAISGKMYSLGWCKGFEEKTKLAVTGIPEKVSHDREGYEDLQTHVPQVNTFIGERFKSLSKRRFDQVQVQYLGLKAPALSPNFEHDPDGLTSHLSFTMDNFANASHTDKDASPYSFFTWLPINKKTGDLIEDDLDVSGGQFVFPRNGFGIDFTGFHGVVECAWKANYYHHLTLPSTTSPSSPHTRLGYSCQLPRQTQLALIRIKEGLYEKDPNKKDWTLRDMATLLDKSFKYPKSKHQSMLIRMFSL
ncbi:hypothetical protein KEM48_010215 [Puccinia striiformis f. sp. tritici PST-130]|nr:hypothetical protein KEM48_010215 [Puccinia striiformis f. sp. tritici PST-130]